MVFCTYFFNKCFLPYGCIFIPLWDIHNYTNQNGKRLNRQEKFRSAGSTGHLNRRRLKVNMDQEMSECNVTLLFLVCADDWNLIP
jgi:hypothetical protein